MAKNNQGQRGLPSAKKGGKNPTNPKKPAIAAKIKNAQGKGKGLTQTRGGGSNHVESNPRGSKVGLKQQGVAAKIAGPSKRGINSLQKAPVKQPAHPKNLKNDLVLHNSVTRADVARWRKAKQLAMPPGAITGSTNFGKFIGK